MRVLVGGTGQHDAGTIVVGEDHRALQRSRCGDHGARANFPQPLAQYAAAAAHCGGRRGEGFTSADQIVIVNTKHQGAQHAPYSAALGAEHELGNLRIRAPRQRAAERGAAAEQQGVGARLGRGHRGAQCGEPAAHHHDLRLRRCFLVSIGIGFSGGTAETRHAANHGLVQMPVRPLECLVVKARRQQRSHRCLTRHRHRNGRSASN